MTDVRHPEMDEIESSRAEKLLAIGLVVFLLVGGFWILDRLGSLPTRPDYMTVAAAEGLPAAESAYRQAETDYQRGLDAAEQARSAMEQARADYEFMREEYRVALERGVDDPALAQAHETARVAFELASTRFEIADAARASLETKLIEPLATYRTTVDRVDRAAKRAEDRYQLIAFALRFGYTFPLFGLSVWLWLRLRRRNARYLILATGFMGFGGIQAVGLIGQYGWYLLRDIGPIAISVTGSAVCVAGLVALRRWLGSARRLATSRLRRGQCPYCGFPLPDGTAHCVGCGRQVLESCPDCGHGNVRESPHCRGCGRALDWA